MPPRVVSRTLAAGLGALLCLTLAGPAQAQLRATNDPSPSASNPSASPSPTDASPSSSPSASPTPDSSASPSASTGTPVTPSPTTTTTSPSPPAVDASPSASPNRIPLPIPIGDGVNPDLGQVDTYLALTAQRDQLVPMINAAQKMVDDARASMTTLALQRSTAQIALEHAKYDQVQTTQQVDNVANQIYQQGDSGLGAIATALTGGPESFLARLNTIQMTRVAANNTVADAVTARMMMAIAEVQATSLTNAIDAAHSTEIAAIVSLSDLQQQLTAIDAQLGQLDIVPPQRTIGPDGCPTDDVPGTLRDGAEFIGAAKLCRTAVKQAATPQAALAIKWAFLHLGAAYACGGAGRMLPFRMDCSSFVSRAYSEGAGLGTAGTTWAPSTRNMVPWDGVSLDPHYAYVAPAALRPGDLVLYDTCPEGGCPYKHVVMYLGSPDGGATQWMAHTNSCGDVAKVETFWGFPTSGHPFMVARRVVGVPGETLSVPGHTSAPAASPSATPKP